LLVSHRIDLAFANDVSDQGIVDIKRWRVPGVLVSADMLLSAEAHLIAAPQVERARSWRDDPSKHTQNGGIAMCSPDVPEPVELFAKLHDQPVLFL
jgi:hypothetical protein